MGRRKTIDRDHLLEVAEGLVTTRGASALTIGEVAKAAGITKGGVQSCFGTKEAMVAAMLERWTGNYDERFDAIAGKDAAPVERLTAHVETTHDHDEASHSRAASLLAVLLQSREHLEGTRSWYESRVAGLDADTEEGRRARLAFLATEGAFFLRFFGLLPMEQEQWDDIFADIRKLLDNGL